MQFAAVGGRVRALVSGGASGLGLATAKYLLQNGAKVVIADLPSAKAEETCLRIGASFVPTDVTDENSVMNLIETSREKWDDNVNTIVNCAGVAIAKRTLSKKGPHDLKSFQNVHNVNVSGTFNMLRLGAEAMASNNPDTDGVNSGERGVIINTASIAAFDGQIGQVAYASSKGAIIAMTLPAARDLAGQGIRVNAIAPGVFLTPMVEGLPPAVQEELGSRVPFPSKLGDPLDYAKLVGSIIFNPFLNGEHIRLDGALRMPPQ